MMLWEDICLCLLWFITGASGASFINCLVYRSLRGESLISYRHSHCESCGHVLSPRDMIPVFGFVFLRGRCRYCGAALPLRHLVGELIMGLTYTAVYLSFGLSPELVRGLVLVTFLYPAAVIDIDTMLVPNIIFILLFLLWICFIPFEEDRGTYIQVSLAGALIIPGIMLAISKLVWLLRRRDGIGGGDIKLLFSIGLYLGLSGSFLNLIIMCILGLLMALILGRGRGEVFPFVPAIALSTAIVYLWGDEIITYYFSLFGTEVRIL